MGLKLLRAIEELLTANPGVSFSKSQIRDTLNIDYNTVLDIIQYLKTNNKIETIQKIGDVERFRWKK